MNSKTLHWHMRMLVVVLWHFFSTAQCPVQAPSDFSISCGQTTNLTAGTNFVTYSIVPTSCTPVPITGTNAFPTTCDDCVTSDIPIGFPFNFYGNIYNSCQIQSNGIVGFGGLTYTGYMPFAIPAGGAPNNYIAGFYADIDIRYGGTITYQLVGTAPNRRFVVSYNNVVPYNAGSAAGTGTASFQIILNENGSFHVLISQLSADWNSSTSGLTGTSGAENIDGTFAFSVPGRNSSDYPAIVPAQNDCNLFNPAPCVFQHWKQGSTILTTNNVLTVTPNSTTTYTAVWDCSGNICSDDTEVVIASSIAPVDVIHCENAPSQSLNVVGGCPVLGAGTTIAQGTTFNSGALATTDSKWRRSGGSAVCTAQTNPDYYYDYVAFTVSTTGAYNLNMCGTGWDAYAVLYQNTFNPQTPCAIPTDFILSDDSGNNATCAGSPRITANLIAGTVYYLVSTSYSANITGAYTWSYTGPAGATISTAPVTMGPLNWYTTATGTTPIATGLTYNPVGAAGSGIANTSVPGTYNFYAACPTAPSCRVAVKYVINPGPTTAGVTICQNASSQALTASSPCGPVTTNLPIGSVFNSGDLSSTDPTFIRPMGSSTTYSASGNNVYYDVFSFQVSVAGTYVFNNCTNALDAYGTLYQNSFVSTAPATNMVITNDDASTLGCSSDPQISAALSPGITYYLVTSSYSVGGTGNYSWTFSSGPAGGNVISIVGAGNELRWYSTPTSTTILGTGASFNPVGVAGSGLANTGTAGTTTYFVECSGNASCRSDVSFVIQPSAGDPSVFGDNSWNVYVYNDNGTYANGALTGNYYGYYTQNTTGSLGVNTDINASYWAPASNPSTAANYQGCILPSNDYFTFVHKRRGFPCGTYSLQMTDWDNATEVRLNGTVIWSCSSMYSAANVCPVGRVANAASVIGVYALDANSTIEIRTSENNGVSQCQLDIIPKTNTLALNNVSKTCPVKGNQWVHFYEHPSGNYLASVRGTTATSDLGNVTVTVYDDANPLTVPSCNNLINTAVMERHWVIKPSIDGAAEVRLPYYGEEYSQLVTAANSNINLNDNLSAQSGVVLTKYAGGTFPATVNNSPFDNCPASGGSGLSTGWVNSGIGTDATTIIPAGEVSVLYSQYTIPGFSEFWLHGSIVISPLAIVLNDFSAECEEGVIQISWTTSSEQGSDNFTLERSRDGLNWNFVQNFDGAGTTNSTSYYTYNDPVNGAFYYRLSQVDYDGKVHYYDPLFVSCNERDQGMVVYPNPSTGSFTVSISSSEEMGESTIELHDVSGKIITSRTVDVSSGTNNVNFEHMQLSKGTYFVSLHGSNTKSFVPVKILIR